MTQVKYNPSDFKAPVIGEITYYDLFGKRQYEDCAEYIMSICIEAGYMKPVKVLPEEHRPASMIEDGFLENTDDGFMLTDFALEKILEKFPACQ